ncbi:MAG: NAD(P)-dependent glycerol-3-phosphate dehydrogenase [Phycisphaerae bacterium]|nr:NAD(P)-dependent glycerol-3-phosphate dehydrogenase [Phycisphaerae bacterium]
MPERIAIVGDGQMGLVLAAQLVETGHAVRLWGPFADAVATLRATRASPRLPEVELPEEVEVEEDPVRAIEDATLLVSAIPVQHLREVWRRFPSAPTPVVSVSKGIEVASLARPSEILRACRGAVPIGVLSGPTIASELARRLPAAMIAASDDPALADLVRRTFRAPWVRVYAGHDPLGVEIAGAAKNVIAIAAGLLDGLGAGVNAKSALLARGLAEIVRLGSALGARAETFFGIAGVGDLATTCFSPEGRNRSCGEAIGRGESLAAHLRATRSVVEGVETSRSIRSLAERTGVEMPISAAVHAVLFEGLAPRQALRSLMERETSLERVG